MAGAEKPRNLMVGFTLRRLVAFRKRFHAVSWFREESRYDGRRTGHKAVITVLATGPAGREVTSEYAIRGTYRDLAIKIDHALQGLIQIKAIGTELKVQHVKQAVDYTANPPSRPGAS